MVNTLWIAMQSQNETAKLLGILSQSWMTTEYYVLQEESGLPCATLPTL